MTQLFLGLGFLTVVGIAWRLLSSSIDKAIDLALETNDPGPVIDTIRNKSVSAQPAAYNHAIQRMWEVYKRPLAAEVIKTLAADHRSERIAQYWLKQLLTAEPALARQSLTNSFIDTHYLPEVAASCGKGG